MPTCGIRPSIASPDRVRASGREDLVEQRLGLVLVGLLGERELADEDLPGLREHALLAGRQAALAVTTPEVTDNLGDLVHVTGCEFLEVGLVPARPVGRLLGIRGPQDLEDPFESFLPDTIPYTNQ